MTDESIARRIADRADRLADLRTRARRLGCTIQSSRGTGYGYYHLLARGHAGNDDYIQIPCHGLDELENYIVALTQALGDCSGRPSFNALQTAWATVQAERQRAFEERERARPILNCAYCDESRDDGQAYRVGPEDIGPNDGYPWVHARCLEPFRERNRRHLEAQGFINGVKVTHERGAR